MITNIMIRFTTLCLLLCMQAAAWAVDPSELLEPQKAFRFSARAIDEATVEVSYKIAKGYYLYKDRFAFEVQPAGTSAGAAAFPPGLPHDDKFFGRQEIFRGDLKILLPVKSADRNIKLAVTSQGCADVGVCYVPYTHKADIVLAQTGSVPATGLTLQQRVEQMSRPQSASYAGDAGVDEGFRFPGLAASDFEIASLFESDATWLVLASFFGFGLLLCFTPCVLPMVPILSGIIVGEGSVSRSGTGKRRAFLLSLSYVLGMAVAYAVAGITASYTGALLSVALQNPWVLSAFGLIFVVLALGMFGLFHLQLPGFIHHRLSAAQQNLTGGRLFSVALMGALSAIVVSPCVAAPLAGALLYISQSRDVVLGGAALFTMALGMGTPLIIVAVSEGALLPKAGPWMNTVKQLFGLLMLAVAVWVVSPLIPVALQMAAWGTLLIIAAMLLKVFDLLSPHARLAPRIAKAFGVVLLLWGGAMILGVMSGSRDPLRPLDRVLGERRDTREPLRFERIRTLAELEARVAASAAAGKPVMLDFYADWCVTCKEMERYTFTDAQVQQRLSGMLVLQADVTAGSEADRELLKRFQLFGPPGIVFFDARGQEVRGVRVIGYQSPEQFLKSIGPLGP